VHNAPHQGRVVRPRLGQQADQFLHPRRPQLDQRGADVVPRDGVGGGKPQQQVADGLGRREAGSGAERGEGKEKGERRKGKTERRKEKGEGRKKK
jgi:hypothetical protein